MTPKPKKRLSAYQASKPRNPRAPQWEPKASKVTAATASHEVVYSDDEREFMMAMDTFKREKSRPFPTWCEVLRVLLSLGYHR